MNPLFQIPSSSLAYLGDAVFELHLRTFLLRHSGAKSGQLHRYGIQFANASFQAEMARQWLTEDLLSEEEADVYRRGRNADPGSMAKHASPAVYRQATGLEALLGFLQLSGAEERIQVLLYPAFEKRWEELRADGKLKEGRQA